MVLRTASFFLVALVIDEFGDFVKLRNLLLLALDLLSLGYLLMELADALEVSSAKLSINV